MAGILLTAFALTQFAAASLDGRSATVLSGAPATANGAAALAILVDGKGPWRDPDWQLTASEFHRMLREAGYKVLPMSPERLAVENVSGSDALLAIPSLERLPLGAFKAIASHAAMGGSILASGGQPFRQALYRDGAGSWYGRDDFDAPVIETISPWYKQYDALRGGHHVRIPIARPRGLTAAEETEGRYQVIGSLFDPVATRFATSRGAELYWVPWPQLHPRERAEFVDLLRAARRRLALLDAGAHEFVSLTREPVTLGARVLNASFQAVEADVAWTVLLDGKSHGKRQVSVRLGPGGSLAVNAPSVEGLPPGEYQVATTLRIGTTTFDRIDGYLRVIDPQAPGPPQERLHIEDGHFTAGGKRVFLNGVNYWPRNVSGLEPARFREYWLTPHNYDPDIVEADLAALEGAGFNVVSIVYVRAEQARPLLDFLQRCRRHHIWAHLYIGSAAESLRLFPERDTLLLQRALLSGNPTVFGYELAWEPRFGKHNDRTAHDSEWRDWVTEQYGSVAVAEQTWGMPAPQNADSALANPSDEEIATDGAHRVIVAAYRRFLDDLVSRVYGRAVRHLHALDPDALVAVRTGVAGTGQTYNNALMGYDLVAGAAHLDAICPEAYGMPTDFTQAQATGFITAYARFAGGGKPVWWLEFGSSVGPLGGTDQTRRRQVLLSDTMMRVAADSGADGTSVWWFPGGWRVEERSDFGILNPDGSWRDAARVLSEWGKKLNFSPPEQPPGGPLVISIDRDSDARGMLGLWQRNRVEYLKARQAGKSVRLATAGSGTDTGNMPTVQVGNVPFHGTGPLKYANAEIAVLHISGPGIERTLENGAQVELPADQDYVVSVFLVNTGEAAWLPATESAGGCAFRTNVGDAPISGRVARFGTTSVGPLHIRLRRQPVDLNGRMVAEGRGLFGETLRAKLSPY